MLNRRSLLALFAAAPAAPVLAAVLPARRAAASLTTVTAVLQPRVAEFENGRMVVTKDRISVFRDGVERVRIGVLD